MEIIKLIENNEIVNAVNYNEKTFKLPYTIVDGKEFRYTVTEVTVSGYYVIIHDSYKYAIEKL